MLEIIIVILIVLAAVAAIVKHFLAGYKSEGSCSNCPYVKKRKKR